MKQIDLKNLKEVRLQAEMTLVGAAKAAGMSVPYLVRLEQGHMTNPSMGILKALGKAYGYDDLAMFLTRLSQ